MDVEKEDDTRMIGSFFRRSGEVKAKDCHEEQEGIEVIRVDMDSM